MHTVTLDLTTKPKGYQKALEKMWKKKGSQGSLCEVGCPSLEPYKTIDRKLWRLRQNSPVQVCGWIKEMTIVDTLATFKVTPWGPRRDFLINEMTNGQKLVVVSRYVVGPSGNVTEVCNVDIVVAGTAADTVIEKLTGELVIN